MDRKEGIVADNNDVDTTTPLDGDGQDVEFPSPEEGEFLDQFPNVRPEDYESRGQTTLATERGYAFVSSDESVPVITHTGVNVSADVAEAVLEESARLDGKVFKRNNDDEEV